MLRQLFRRCVVHEPGSRPFGGALKAEAGLRLLTLKTASLMPFPYETTALGLGAVLGAYAGASGLRRLSPVALTKAVFALLLALGLVMISEAVVPLAPTGMAPDAMLPRMVFGLALGCFDRGCQRPFRRRRGRSHHPDFGLRIWRSHQSRWVAQPDGDHPHRVKRHYRAGALSDREIVIRLILPMGLGAIAGGICGGLLVGGGEKVCHFGGQKAPVEWLRYG